MQKQNIEVNRKEKGVMMEQDRKEYLDKDESEKMCSSKIGEAGEMCSPADT